jgi:hypothetical protein
MVNQGPCVVDERISVLSVATADIPWTTRLWGRVKRSELADYAICLTQVFTFYGIYLANSVL